MIRFVCAFLLLNGLALAAPIVAPQPNEPNSAKPKQRSRELYVALDDDFDSKLLKSELTRDWVKPGVSGNEAKTLAEMKKLSVFLKANLKIIFVERPNTPDGVKLPAIRFGRSRWVTLDKRMFRMSTWPLKSMEWHYWSYFEEDYKAQTLKEHNKKVIEYEQKLTILERRIRNQLSERYPSKRYYELKRRRVATYYWDVKETKWVQLIRKAEGLTYKQVTDAWKEKFGELEQYRYTTCEIFKDFVEATGAESVIDEETGFIVSKQTSLDMTGIDGTFEESLFPYMFFIKPPPYADPGEQFDNGWIEELKILTQLEKEEKERSLETKKKAMELEKRRESSINQLRVKIREFLRKVDLFFYDNELDKPVTAMTTDDGDPL